MPLIQTGASVNFLDNSLDVIRIAEPPVHGFEQSNNRRSAVICFEFIISGIVYALLEYAFGLSIAFL